MKADHKPRICLGTWNVRTKIQLDACKRPVETPPDLMRCCTMQFTSTYPPCLEHLQSQDIPLSIAASFPAAACGIGLPVKPGPMACSNHSCWPVVCFPMPLAFSAGKGVQHVAPPSRSKIPFQPVMDVQEACHRYVL